MPPLLPMPEQPQAPPVGPRMISWSADEAVPRDHPEAALGVTFQGNTLWLLVQKKMAEMGAEKELECWMRAGCNRSSC